MSQLDFEKYIKILDVKDDFTISENLIENAAYLKNNKVRSFIDNVSIKKGFSVYNYLKNTKSVLEKYKDNDYKLLYELVNDKREKLNGREVKTNCITLPFQKRMLECNNYSEYLTFNYLNGCSSEYYIKREYNMTLEFEIFEELLEECFGNSFLDEL